MTITRSIPDIYTDYEDGHLGAVAASLANVEAKIGGALSGTPLKVYSLSGADAKKTARTLFQGGPLLKAIEEAFDAGSTHLYAVRIGSGSRASMTIPSLTGAETLKLKGPYGESGNKHYVNVMQTFERMIAGYVAVFSGTPAKVVFYDEDLVATRTIELDDDIASVAGVEPDFFVQNLIGQPGFRVVGVSKDNKPCLWCYGGNGILLSDGKLDLSALLDEGEVLRGLGGAMSSMEGNRWQVTTDKRLLFIKLEDGAPVLDGSWTYADFGLTAPDISSFAEWMDIDAALLGEDTPAYVFLLDRTTKAIYRFSERSEQNALSLATADISALLGSGTPEGITADFDTGDLLIAVQTSDSNDKLLRLKVDWSDPTKPVVTEVSTTEVDKGICGLGYHLADAEVLTTITVQDRSVSPLTSRSYSGRGRFTTATKAVAKAISDGGVYEAELLSDPAFWLMPSLTDGGDSPDPTYFAAMSGGADGMMSV